jgi:hypothetical protein
MSKTIRVTTILVLVAAGCVFGCSTDPGDEEVASTDESLSAVAERPHRFCGGIAGIPCRRGQVCVDDPRDNCNPDRGHQDCSGICVPDKFCGGIASFPCDKNEECIDDPRDDCHPATGGADCSGVCRPLLRSY